MGAITGIPVGAAQAFLLRDRVARSWVWAAAMPLLWALGWTVTAAAGVGVDSQYAVFGAFGAITVMALSGVLLDRLRAATPVPTAPPAHRDRPPNRRGSMIDRSPYQKRSCPASCYCGPRARATSIQSTWSRCSASNGNGSSRSCEGSDPTTGLPRPGAPTGPRTTSSATCATAT